MVKNEDGHPFVSGAGPNNFMSKNVGRKHGKKEGTRIWEFEIRKKNIVELWFPRL